MIARTSLIACSFVLAGGLLTNSASAGDFGISFRYSRSSPVCYTPYATRSYVSYVPVDYGCYDYYDYAAPVYVDCAPAPVVYETYYPTTYRTTYTRSRYYSRPIRYSGVSINYIGHHHRHHHGHHHSRRHATYRHRSVHRSHGHHYSRSVRVYRR